MSNLYIPRKLPLVSLVCTVFVTYPNVVWIPWNLNLLTEGELPGFWAFFAFRMLYFYTLFYIQLRRNLSPAWDTPFPKRFALNLLYTFIGCTIFVGLSWGLPFLGVQTGYVGNILIFQFVVVCLLCTFIGHISALYNGKRRQEEEIERLRVENLQSRCDALTNQINPHFFFNSLGGISSLIRRGKDDEALNYTAQLSDIFRYILQSDRKGIVSLNEELDFMRAFSHVMEVRYANKLTFRFDIPEEKGSMRLPVLSLLPLAENATVHNTIDSLHPMTIRIRLTEDNILEVSNPIYPKLTPPETNGTGLMNLANRFRLMMREEIRIENDGKTFKVFLPLKNATDNEGSDC